MNNNNIYNYQYNIYSNIYNSQFSYIHFVCRRSSRRSVLTPEKTIQPPPSYSSFFSPPDMEFSPSPPSPHYNNYSDYSEYERANRNQTSPARIALAAKHASLSSSPSSSPARRSSSRVVRQADHGPVIGDEEDYFSSFTDGDLTAMIEDEIVKERKRVDALQIEKFKSTQSRIISR